MKSVTVIVLLIITVYTFGFAITLWKEKQKVECLAVFFLIVTLIILPFFSIF